MPELSVILPAYCEEENLRVLLPRLKQALTQLKTTYEILVVDTETPLDNTRSACFENEVIHLQRKGGNTFGDAVRTGIQSAQGQYIIFMDADGSHSPEFIEKLYQHRLEYDLVMASRYIDGGYTENYRALVWMSRILNLSYSLILGLKYEDISNSFKLYPASKLKELPLFCKNFDIIEEILFKLHRRNKNLKVKEVPFSFKKRMFGETKRNLFWFIITYIFTIIRLRLLGQGKEK